MHNYHQLSIYCWLLHWIIQCVTLAAFPLLPTASQSFDPFDNAADKAPATGSLFDQGFHLWNSDLLPGEQMGLSENGHVYVGIMMIHD